MLEVCPSATARLGVIPSGPSRSQPSPPAACRHSDLRSADDSGADPTQSALSMRRRPRRADHDDRAGQRLHVRRRIGRAGVRAGRLRLLRDADLSGAVRAARDGRQAQAGSAEQAGQPARGLGGAECARRRVPPHRAPPPGWTPCGERLRAAGAAAAVRAADLAAGDAALRTPLGRRTDCRRTGAAPGRSTARRPGRSCDPGSAGDGGRQGDRPARRSVGVRGHADRGAPGPQPLLPTAGGVVRHPAADLRGERLAHERARPGLEPRRLQARGAAAALRGGARERRPADELRGADGRLPGQLPLRRHPRHLPARAQRHRR